VAFKLPYLVQQYLEAHPELTNVRESAGRYLATEPDNSLHLIPPLSYLKVKHSTRASFETKLTKAMEEANIKDGFQNFNPK
jgi:hypothetical protein